MQVVEIYVVSVMGITLLGVHISGITHQMPPKERNNVRGYECTWRLDTPGGIAENSGRLEELCVETDDYVSQRSSIARSINYL